MVKKLRKLFRSLAQENRLRILRLLKEGESYAAELALVLGISPSTAWRHLQAMNESRLVQERKTGRVVFYSIVGKRDEWGKLVHEICGWLDSDNSWTNVEADLSKYFDLGTSGWFRQQVLALDFWTSNTPTWQTDPQDDQIVTHRPPPKYGSTLGGWDRLRAYPTGRFNAKSAVYYSAELRLIPRYRPLKDWAPMKYFQIDWWQVVPFVEAGRVGPDYDSDLFYKDLKWDVGFGFRLMAFRTVVRLDMAYGKEGAAAWAMIEQPFSRQSDP